jgi:hypothetical protein
MKEKLSIEVTEKGWTITYTDLNGDNFTEDHELTEYGSTTVGTPFELDRKIDNPDLIDAVSTINSGCYDFANSLR